MISKSKEERRKKNKRAMGPLAQLRTARPQRALI
jgi:hypothetical protein